MVLAGSRRMALVTMALVAGALVWGAYAPRGGTQIALAVHEIRPGITCPQSPDNGAYRLTRQTLAPGTFTYTLYTDGFPSNSANAIASAFGAWEATQLGNRFNGTTNNGAAPGIVLDGINSISMGSLGGSTIAATYVWYNVATKQIVEFDMVFSDALSWALLNATHDSDGDGCIEASENATDAAQFDVQDIAAHEITHVLGLGHTSPNGANNAQTAYPYGQAGEVYKRSLASGDIAGVNIKY